MLGSKKSNLFNLKEQFFFLRKKKFEEKNNNNFLVQGFCSIFAKKRKKVERKGKKK